MSEAASPRSSELWALGESTVSLTEESLTLSKLSLLLELEAEELLLE